MANAPHTVACGAFMPEPIPATWQLSPHIAHLPYPGTVHLLSPMLRDPANQVKQGGYVRVSQC